MSDSVFDPKVAVGQVTRKSEPYHPDELRLALDRLGTSLGWAGERGPLTHAIPEGATVLVKPNMVLHRNEGAGGLEPLITHPNLIQLVVEAALTAGASRVAVGDAPLQSCDFPALLRATGLDSWSGEMSAQERRFTGIRDFRRTTCITRFGVRVAAEDLQSMDGFTLFDLGAESLLEEVTSDAAPFRVCWYDPRLMAKTHGLNRHQYLVARDVLDADIVLNLPKLKTHKKAGITGALKNLIGINGNKEYLPHHRFGNLKNGGDCYPGTNPVKSVLEQIADRQNTAESRGAATFWQGLHLALTRITRLQGDELGIEGSWHGNDTIWRTCLDLNRILIYGRSDAGMAETPQRRVLHIIDGVVAGQQNGPLAPNPLQLGVLIGGVNAAALDWFGAHLLGYDPYRVPLVLHAFDKFRWPISSATPSEISLVGDWGTGTPESIIAPHRQEVLHPVGWRAAALAHAAKVPQ